MIEKDKNVWKVKGAGEPVVEVWEDFCPEAPCSCGYFTEFGCMKKTEGGDLLNA
jgi:hypothetical protein